MAQASDRAPAFQFYPRDYVGDFDVAAMTLEEAGAYSILLSYAWLKDGLPDDLDKIRKVLHVTPVKFSRIWNVVGEKFHSDSCGKLRNGRQEEERAKQREWAEKSAQGGRRGASRRWPKDNHPVTTLITTLTNGATPNQHSSSSSASSEDIRTQDGGRMDDYWNFWREAMARIRKASVRMVPTPKEQEQMMDLLTRYPDDALLRKITEEYLSTNDKAVREKGTSLGWLVYWAGEIEGWLRGRVS